MCIERVSQCDWCLYRRHIDWDECVEFKKLLLTHMRHQDFPMPTPENCPVTAAIADDGQSFINASVSVKIGLGRCPSPACVSELFASIERKKQEKMMRRLRLADRQYRMQRREQHRKWSRKYAGRKPVKDKCTTSLLTLGLLKLDEEKHDSVPSSSGEGSSEGHAPPGASSRDVNPNA